MGCSGRPCFAMHGNTHPDTESKHIDVSGAAWDNSLTKSLSLPPSPSDSPNMALELEEENSFERVLATFPLFYY